MMRNGTPPREGLFGGSWFELSSRARRTIKQSFRHHGTVRYYG